MATDKTKIIVAAMEPTPEMLRAGCDKLIESMDRLHQPVAVVTDIWIAMGECSACQVNSPEYILKTSTTGPLMQMASDITAAAVHARHAGLPPRAVGAVMAATLSKTIKDVPIHQRMEFCGEMTRLIRLSAEASVDAERNGKPSDYLSPEVIEKMKSGK